MVNNKKSYYVWALIACCMNLCGVSKAPGSEDLDFSYETSSYETSSSEPNTPRAMPPIPSQDPIDNPEKAVQRIKELVFKLKDAASGLIESLAIMYRDAHYINRTKQTICALKNEQDEEIVAAFCIKELRFYQKELESELGICRSSVLRVEKAIKDLRSSAHPAASRDLLTHERELNSLESEIRTAEQRYQKAEGDIRSMKEQDLDYYVILNVLDPVKEAQCAARTQELDKYLSRNTMSPLICRAEICIKNMKDLEDQIRRGIKELEGLKTEGTARIDRHCPLHIATSDQYEKVIEHLRQLPQSLSSQLYTLFNKTLIGSKLVKDFQIIKASDLDEETLSRIREERLSNPIFHRNNMPINEAIAHEYIVNIVLGILSNTETYITLETHVSKLKAQLFIDEWNKLSKPEKLQWLDNNT